MCITVGLLYAVFPMSLVTLVTFVPKWGILELRNLHAALSLKDNEIQVEKKK